MFRISDFLRRFRIVCLTDSRAWIRNFICL